LFLIIYAWQFIKKLLNITGKFFPKSRISLPLSFRNKRSFSSKRITTISFFVLIFVSINSFKNFEKMGEVQNFIVNIKKYEDNLEIAKKY
jgi:hypothetical protein